MKMIKLLILILTFSIIYLTGYSISDLEDNHINNFNCKSDKLKTSIFDNVKWEKVNEKNGITLYIQENKGKEINFYKAEKELNSQQGEKFFKNLMDFDKYTEIFPRILIYKKIKDISKNKYLIYCQTDFLYLQNRDYYVFLEYSIENKNNIKEWTIEWYPLDSYLEEFPEIKEVVRLKTIYGRWKIIEHNDNIKISIEYYNNFNLPVAKLISVPFEKTSTVDVLNKIINYTNQ